MMRSRLIGLGLCAVFVTGCGPGRKVQCRNLGQATRQVMNQVTTVHQGQIGRNAYDPTFETEIAAAWESGVALVNDVELSDSELKTMQEQLAIAYQQAADTHRQVATLIPADGRLSPELEQQVDDLQLQAEAGIPPVISELNLYCIGS